MHKDVLLDLDHLQVVIIEEFRLTSFIGLFTLAEYTHRGGLFHS